MPGGLTASQRLTGPDGLPTMAARIGVVTLMAIAAVAGYAAGPRGEDPTARQAAAVPASRLAGELPLIAPENGPALKGAVALPALRRGDARPRATAPPAPTPMPEAVTVATPEPVTTPEPAAELPVTTTPAVPAPPPPRPARPAPTPAPTFDSSG